MSTVSHIVEQIGSEKIQSLLGISKHSIRAAKRDAKFPANWFLVLDQECRAMGIECPKDIFAFKAVVEEHSSSPVASGLIGDDAA